MRQFQFKFYREWYDALEELSHEDRAEAALALLEYAYDDKLPEDKFIRIVTTLMRNKVDKDKASYNKPANGKPTDSTPVPRQELECVNANESNNDSELKCIDINESENIETNESESINGCVSKTIANNESASVDSNAVSEEQSDITDSINSLRTILKQPVITIPEAKEVGITRETGHEINEILKEHYNLNGETFLEICKSKQISPETARENAKLYMVHLALKGDWQPHQLPDRSQPSFLSQIDNHALTKE